jgi:protein-S-isoprenylcysteine O-methyltransferase Ste14
MQEKILWILVSLFVLNRLLLWVIFFRNRTFGVYGTIVIIINHIVSLTLPLLPQSRLSLDMIWRIVGIILFLAGMYIIKAANDEFDKMKIRPNTITTNLITRGIYSIVRHPIYLGQDIYVIGWFLAWNALDCLYIIPLVLLLNWQQAYFEEKYILIKEFGAEYEKYKNRVGMFVPRLLKKNRT